MAFRRSHMALGFQPRVAGVLLPVVPGLFPGVTPFRRAGGAHVVPETLSLHIPVVLRAHGSRELSGR